MEQRTRGPGVHHDERRREIADAVLAIVAERGLQAVSLTEVAAAADVSPGRVQHYFGTKQDLLAAAFERGNELSSARIRARVGGDLDAAPAREVLTTVLTELIPHDEATTAHLRVRQSFAALALADEAIAERMRAQYVEFHRQLAELVHASARPGGAEPSPEEVATSLAAHAEGLAYYVLIGLVDAGSARERITAALERLYG